MTQSEQSDKPQSFLSSKAKMVGLFFAIVPIILTLNGWWMLEYATSPIPQMKTQTFKVVAGDNLTTVSKRLKSRGLIQKTWPLKLIVMLQPELANFKVGTYQLNSSLSPSGLLMLFASGKEIQFKITFIEGTTFKEWQENLAAHPSVDFSPQHIEQLKADFASVTESANSYEWAWIEGQLFPDTYRFSDGTSAVEIVSRAAATLNNELNQLWPERSDNLPITTPYQALILASIIEKETGFSGERGKIASVFVNRLNKRMRLQTDPTVIYGMAELYNGDITRAHLKDINPYNTYVINGLPPTPIAMPGRKSIEAALNPEQTDFLYFVAKGDGSHHFSKTLKEHNKAVRKYLLSKTDNN